MQNLGLSLVYIEYEEVGSDISHVHFRLVRARYQDNLEFMQWLKKFAEVNHHPDIETYDAISAREKGKGFKQFKPAQANAKRPARKKPASSKARAPDAGRSATPPFQKGEHARVKQKCIFASSDRGFGLRN